MARDIQAIIDCLDRYLEQSGQATLDAVVAGRILANAGYLNSNSSHPDKLLRAMLRKGKIPHAYQMGGSNTTWVIPHSRTSPRSKPHQPASIVHQPQATTVPVMPGLAGATPSGTAEEFAAQLMDAQGGRLVGEIDDSVPDKLACIACGSITWKHCLPYTLKFSSNGNTTSFTSASLRRA